MIGLAGAYTDPFARATHKLYSSGSNGPCRGEDGWPSGLSGCSRIRCKSVNIEGRALSSTNAGNVIVGCCAESSRSVYVARSNSPPLLPSLKQLMEAINCRTIVVIGSDDGIGTCPPPLLWCELLLPPCCWSLSSSSPPNPSAKSTRPASANSNHSSPSIPSPPPPYPPPPPPPPPPLPPLDFALWLLEGDLGLSGFL